MVTGKSRSGDAALPILHVEQPACACARRGTAELDLLREIAVLSLQEADTPAIAVPAPPPPNDHWAMFNVDVLLTERVIQLHRRHRFACAIETGTFKGNTTVGLAKLFPEVFTIELDAHLYEQTKPRFVHYPNVTALLGNSAGILREILPRLSYPLFAYLDAHWGDYWPLPDELKILLAVKRPKVIMIHDFRVPGRDFGYDSYKGHACCLEYLAQFLPHDECRYSFNERTAPNSANRGVLFIEHLLDE